MQASVCRLEGAPLAVTRRIARRLDVSPLRGPRVGWLACVLAAWMPLSAVAAGPSRVELPNPARPRSATPREAIVRIAAPENAAVSYGTGTLIDVRDQYGLVVTNWHVVRDATGPVEVRFPCGFRSKARALKVDADWDLAALVIWRPPVQPVHIATRAPRPGDVLTICGWGQGSYREATGTCTQYVAPRIDFPREMVELSVEARQGDSGGPILNQQGELAGVLFGAGHGFTLGSFGGRVETFLASLGPDIGRSEAFVAEATSPAQPTRPEANSEPRVADGSRREALASAASRETTPFDQQGVQWQGAPRDEVARHAGRGGGQMPVMRDEGRRPTPHVAVAPGIEIEHAARPAWRDLAGAHWFVQVRNFLAVVGVLAILLRVMKLIV